MLPVRKYFEAVTALRIARSETMSCLEAKKEARSDAVKLTICEPERFAELQTKIEATTAQIAGLVAAIRQLDGIIETNGLAPGWLDVMKHRLSSAGGSIVQQQSNISVWASFYTQKNTRKSPEEALADPEFKEKREAAEKIIVAEKAFLETAKPIVKEIESILSGCGC